jgi:hypothetical protein
MIRRIMSLFSKPDLSWKDTEINRLRVELSAAQSLRRKVIPIIDVEMGMPEPRNTTEYYQWVDAWASFHEGYLAAKLRTMIAEVREDLDWAGYRDQLHQAGLPEGTTRAEFDAFLRGTSNAFRLLLEYGERMKGELQVINKP